MQNEGDIFIIYTSLTIIEDNIGKYEHKSGNIYASPEYNGNTALHTLAIYMSAYKGIINIQATLDNTPSGDSSYYTISSKVYNGYSGIDYVNFNGVYTHIRIVHVPATRPADSDNNDPTYFGSLDKVLYRS